MLPCRGSPGGLRAPGTCPAALSTGNRGGCKARVTGQHAKPGRSQPGPLRPLGDGAEGEGGRRRRGSPGRPCSSPSGRSASRRSPGRREAGRRPEHRRPAPSPRSPSDSTVTAAKPALQPQPGEARQRHNAVGSSFLRVLTAFKKKHEWYSHTLIGMNLLVINKKSSCLCAVICNYLKMLNCFFF